MPAIVHVRLQAISNFKSLSDQLNPSSRTSSPFPLQLGFRHQKSLTKPKSVFISCKASFNGSNFHTRSSNGDHRDDNDDADDYIQAFLMVTETINHHHLRSRGFREETTWNTGLLLPFSIHAKDSQSAFSSFGHEFLRRFKTPTVFLKLACDGDLILPILVGDFAIEKLIDSLRGDDDGDFPDQFQFMKNVVDRLGYEVKMVRITKRILNTYHARIYVSKPGEKAILTVDARPSDAINLAKRCRVPIYVNKQIVLSDAIVYGARRGKTLKSVYDVTLDSAVEGTDFLSEELRLLRSLRMAINEERYQDAVVLRNKLTKLLGTPRYEL